MYSRLYAVSWLQVISKSCWLCVKKLYSEISDNKSENDTTFHPQTNIEVYHTLSNIHNVWMSVEWNLLQSSWKLEHLKQRMNLHKAPQHYRLHILWHAQLRSSCLYLTHLITSKICSAGVPEVIPFLLKKLFTILRNLLLFF